VQYYRGALIKTAGGMMSSRGLRGWSRLQSHHGVFRQRLTPASKTILAH